MNGWLLVRIAGIVVGAATLLRVATNEKLVTYDPLFLAWMDWLSDIVELGFLTKLVGPLLFWGIEQVRSLGISVPDLQDEWRPAFVLTMLIFGAVARQLHSWSYTLWVPAFALGVALISGLYGTLVLVGMFPIIFLLTVLFARTDSRWALLFFFIGALFLADKGVAVVAIAVAIAALAMLVEALVSTWRFGWYEDAARPLNVGMDILGTMGIAFAIAVAVAEPPIW